MTTTQERLQVCQQCQSLCCRLVLPLVTQKERNKILDEGYNNSFIKIDNGIYKINSDEQKKCPYLTHNYTCEIHHLKPTLCRIWPVIPYNKKKKRGCIVIKCPLYSHLTKEMIQQAKKEAETIPDTVIHHLWNIPQEIKKKYKIFEYEEI